MLAKLKRVEHPFEITVIFGVRDDDTQYYFREFLSNFNIFLACSRNILFPEEG
jgi:sulfite reductase alpha subunit-like flavoprotein